MNKNVLGTKLQRCKGFWNKDEFLFINLSLNHSVLSPRSSPVLWSSVEACGAHASHSSMKQQILYTQFININIYLIQYPPSILWHECAIFYFPGPLVRNIKGFFFNLSVNLNSIAVDVLAHLESDPRLFLNFICLLGSCSSFYFQHFSSIGGRGAVSLVNLGGDWDISSNYSKFHFRHGDTYHLVHWVKCSELVSLMGSCLVVWYVCPVEQCNWAESNLRAILDLAHFDLQPTKPKTIVAPHFLQKLNRICVDRYGVNPALIWVCQAQTSIF